MVYQICFNVFLGPRNEINLIYVNWRFYRLYPVSIKSICILMCLMGVASYWIRFLHFYVFCLLTWKQNYFRTLFASWYFLFPPLNMFSRFLFGWYFKPRKFQCFLKSLELIQVYIATIRNKLSCFFCLFIPCDISMITDPLTMAALLMSCLNNSFTKGWILAW